MQAVKELKAIVTENIKHGDQTLRMAGNELKKRYSGSFLGLAWSVVRPVLFIAVYWFGIEVGIRGENR